MIQPAAPVPSQAATPACILGPANTLERRARQGAVNCSTATLEPQTAPPGHPPTVPPLETVERVRPHALAVDCLAFGAIAGAEKSGLPAALFIRFLIHPPVDGVTPFGLGLHAARGPLGRLRDRAFRAVMRQMFGFGLEPLNEARRQLGLPLRRDVFHQFLTLPRRLVLTSREYDFVPVPLPEQVRYVGPQLDDPAWPEQWTPPWCRWRRKREPLYYGGQKGATCAVA
ncbi:MAG: hypothetical protein IT167_26110 [Bryobacterales bacterium]|nr:hypothetical protein [Bryobacterales bacterium]